jgi:putative Flp pilus-assembly TadE/G-like protein
LAQDEAFKNAIALPVDSPGDSTVNRRGHLPQFHTFESGSEQRDCDPCCFGTAVARLSCGGFAMGAGSRLKSRLQDESGQALIIAAFAITALLGFIALGTDVGLLLRGRRGVQTAADAAAIAGSVDLLYNGSTIEQTLTVNTQVTIDPLIHLPGLPDTHTLKGQAIQTCAQ